MHIVKLFVAITFLIATGCKHSPSQEKTEYNDTILVNNLSDFRKYITQDDVKVKMKAGNYQVDYAECIRFFQISANNAFFDMKGVRFNVDSKLFTRDDLATSNDGNSMYCVIELAGNNTTIEGLYVETYGGYAGRQSKNKIFNVIGSGSVLKDVEIRTAGSHPWGYGSLYGIGGTIVRKMNGIRVGSPAKNVKLIGCKVHMRAMGHAIFLQGCENTLIEDCHVDGLLRTTNDILNEKSGYAFENNFYAGKGGYIEGTTVAKDGKILPDEITSLSEDGIRMYSATRWYETKSTTIRNCTVTGMRRGICTGLSTSADKVINCSVTNCTATAYNVGNEDTLINCNADAKYAEAFCVPYLNAKNAYVDMTILDSRNGLANDLLAKINGTGHHVSIKATNPDYIPSTMKIKLSTKESYGNFSKNPQLHATSIKVENKTNTEILLLPGTIDADITSKGKVF